jgi:hypothetical protein
VQEELVQGIEHIDQILYQGNSVGSLYKPYYVVVVVVVVDVVVVVVVVGIIVPTILYL